MNADKIVRDLEEIIKCSSVGAVDKHYGESVSKALSAFNAIRELLKVQWESEHNYTRSFVKEADEILSEFHLTEDEVTELASSHKESDRKICRNCKHLSDEQTVIGRKCICPYKKYHSETAMWHQKSCPACKHFKRRE